LIVALRAVGAVVGGGADGAVGRAGAVLNAGGGAEVVVGIEVDVRGGAIPDNGGYAVEDT
jgi:hypothetical protein